MPPSLGEGIWGRMVLVRMIRVFPSESKCIKEYWIEKMVVHSSYFPWIKAKCCL